MTERELRGEKFCEQSNVLIFTPILQRHNTENLKQIFPENELHGLSLNFHFLVPVSDLYIPAISLPIYIFCCRKICGPILWEYINRWHTHECGNWDWGRAIPFLGIHKWDFCCSILLYPPRWEKMDFHFRTYCSGTSISSKALLFRLLKWDQC